MKVRTRIAPSPTGFVHIGTIHNALFARAYAKGHDGDFILRIEDTDQKRYVEGANEELFVMLDEFGLTPDEGPKQGGPYEPYIQSERLATGIYKEAAETLVERGYAYYCFLTEEELKTMKEVKGKQRVAFRSPFRDYDINEARKRIKAGEAFVIRLKVPNNEKISVQDAILGEVSWNSNDVDDQVLLKSDGFPTYHLAVVVDDNIMKISHVTRAYEWLPSTPKQVLLYKYLGFEQPIYAHSSLVLDPDGGKLSKRKGNVSAKQFLIEGYLPNAILNFLMLLGWTPPIQREFGEKEREIFSHEEFISMLELSDRHKSNAIFNREKLLWFNQEYIKMQSNEELSNTVRTWLEKYAADKSLIEQIKNDTALEAKLALVKERSRTLVEIVESIKFFYEKPTNIDWNVKQVATFADKLESIKEDLKVYHSSLSDNAAEWNQESWVASMKSLSEKYQIKPGDSFMVLRIAEVGGPFSPPLFEALQILGKKEVLERLS